MILGCGGLSFGMFSDISGLYTLDDRSFPFPAWQPQMFPDTATCSLQGKKPLPCLPSWEPLLWSNHGCKQAGGLQAEAGPQGRVTVKKKKKTSNRTDVSSILGFALLCFCLKSHPRLGGGAGVQHCSGCTFSCSWPLPSWPLWDLFDTVPNQTSLKWILS